MTKRREYFWYVICFGLVAPISAIPVEIGFFSVPVAATLVPSAITGIVGALALPPILLWARRRLHSSGDLFGIFVFSLAVCALSLIPMALINVRHLWQSFTWLYLLITSSALFLAAWVAIYVLVPRTVKLPFREPGRTIKCSLAASTPSVRDIVRAAFAASGIAGVGLLVVASLFFLPARLSSMKLAALPILFVFAAVPAVYCIKGLPNRWSAAGRDGGASKTIGRFLGIGLFFFFTFSLLPGRLLATALARLCIGAPQWFGTAAALFGYFAGYLLALWLLCTAVGLLGQKVAGRPPGRLDPDTH